MTMRFLLNTNIVSDLIRHPRGKISDRIAEVGEEHVCTSIIVAAELRFGSTRKNSSRLTAQLEAVLGANRCARARSACRRRIWCDKSRPGANRPANRRKRLAHSRSRNDIGTHNGD